MGNLPALPKITPLFAAAALAGALTVSSCHAGHLTTQTGTTQDPRAVSVAVSGAPATLDFTRTGGAAIPQAMMANIYETLVRIAPDGSLQPWLAKSWHISDDAMTYTFHLRENVTFSNGSPFNADSVKFSLERVTSEAWTNGRKKQMSVVDRVDVIDPLTVAVTLSRPSNEWLWNMGTMVGAMMTPDGVTDEQLNRHPVGTGPFTVARWAPGQAIELRARGNYWGPAPASETVAIRYFPDPTGATNALQSGDVDVVYSMQSPELLDALTAQGIYTVATGSTNGEVLLSMNNRRAPFDDVRVRRAVMYAIDRQAVIDTAWDGNGTDTGGVPVPPTDPWYYVSDAYPFNPDKARELLAEAGINDTNNRVVISVPSRPYAQNVSEIVVSMLNDVGFDTTIESTEFPAVWLSKVYRQHDYDMSIIMHIEPRDIPALFGNPDYYLGFDSPRVRELLAAADTAPPDQYPAKMKQAVEEIMDQAAADTVFNYPNIVVFAPGVEGIDPNAVSDGLDLSALVKTDPESDG
ncbi:ABC transporter substrate-binding protein [Corynebacterium mendelii]|uniref:ABC transporter substrate-binding protein n=1 Tax=Corynebacterium mendelii TaxID=2765362 RepID=A0A939IVG5_9CORY|nr:ABC transporter substrate-binding protein [Corynebacterium mendelii]MBN9644211.1 ABC transporter substrate-binding protein [Corynebacterium mendelii]